MPRHLDLAKHYLVNTNDKYEKWDAILNAWILCGYFLNTLPLGPEQVRGALSTPIVWC